MHYLDDGNVSFYPLFEILSKLLVKSLIPNFICPVYVKLDENKYARRIIILTLRSFVVLFVLACTMLCILKSGVICSLI